MKGELTTPVVLFAFNRPEVTSIVFRAIAEARPQRLLLICDGPRADQPEDTARVRAVREVLEQVDWPCEVSYCYSDENLGCKWRVSSGLAWVFRHVEEAIILEDDCLPHPTFFSFCQILLEHYRDDERVASISGNNFQLGISRTPYSYYFSKYFHCWGWATWRRTWQRYDVRMRSWPRFRDEGKLAQWADSSLELWYWQHMFDRQYAGKIDTWDFPWMYGCWEHDGLTILPDKNLVSNIGFSGDGTHTRGDSPLANLCTWPVGSISHPPDIVRHRIADMHSFPIVYYRDSWSRRIRRNVRRLLGRVAV